MQQWPCSAISMVHMVATCLPAGWLLRMACNERMKEEFDTLHEAVIEMLKVGGRPELPAVVFCCSFCAVNCCFWDGKYQHIDMAQVAEHLFECCGKSSVVNICQQSCMQQLL